MRRKLTTLAAKSGHNRWGNPRQLIDETVYRSHANHLATGGVWDPKYSGWSNPSRPRDYAIFLRTVNPQAPGIG